MSEACGVFRSILVPFDGSEYSSRALRIAADIARRCAGEVTVLYVAEPGADVEAARRRVVEEAASLGVNVRFKVRRPTVYSSIANEVLQEIVEGGYDAVVLGARGNTVNDDMMIGSVALAVIVNSPVTVVVVR